MAIDPRIIQPLLRPAEAAVTNLNKIVGDTTTNIGKSVNGIVDSVKTNYDTITEKIRGINFGATKKKAAPTEVIVVNAQGLVKAKDLRVRIKVPNGYLGRFTNGSSTAYSGGELGPNGISGIIFPYTPTISYEHKADYSSANPMHSNFALYFYQRSSISPITITGKFTVQNEKDAAVYISTLHLLRSLTKMQSGGIGGDPNSGSPPPVCRLFAYGEFMLDNVPIVISSIRVELPDTVDYFTIDKSASTGYTKFGPTSVPTMSTLAVTCIPMYSRAEMQKFSVNGYLNNSPTSGRSRGFL